VNSGLFSALFSVSLTHHILQLVSTSTFSLAMSLQHQLQLLTLQSQALFRIRLREARNFAALVSTVRED
jgi:hypothetical protein